MVVETVKSFMKIFITGSNGMLGSALCDVLSIGKDKITGLDLTERPAGSKHLAAFIKCDITDYAGLSSAIKDVSPDIIIHTAAFTDVDSCEEEPGEAESVNGLGTRYVAETALESGSALLYISTDFVFDGQKKSPYKEEDAPNPINLYGRSKLDGEKFVMDVMKEKPFFVIRSSWLFGKGGRNFVDTILKKAESEKEIRVVSDQFASPTYTLDLANAIKIILDLFQKRRDIYGIYHITNSGDCSWYRLAQKTLELKSIYGLELIPIMSGELDRPAERPAMSILDNTRFTKLIGESLRSWEKALEEYLLVRR